MASGMCADSVEVQVHIDRALGLSVQLSVPCRTTIGDLKVQLAQEDPTGELRAEDICLRSADGISRGDEEPVTREMPELNLCRVDDSGGGRGAPDASPTVAELAPSCDKPPVIREAPQLWEVIGGKDKGGVLVRTGPTPSAEKAEARLSTGSLLEQLELVEPHLRYKLLAGTGPNEGWVLTRLSHKDLVVRRAAPSAPRIWAISDVHSDMKENMEWVRGVCGRRDAFAKDTLIVAGDVASSLEVLRETLALFKRAFENVFYCPGNHELWCTTGKASTDSMQKLNAIYAICDELDVLIRPTELPAIEPSGKPVLIVPIASWHEPGFDSEPAMDTGWKKIPEVNQCLTDYHMCRWPEGLSQLDGSVASRMDAENDTLWAGSALECASSPSSGPSGRYAAVISFSHFLPRIELVPEKRFMVPPTLNKGVGSRSLGGRVAKLRPDVHVFGHTHFGWDAEIDGIRYIQAPLSYPTERKQRGFTVSLGEWAPSDSGSSPQQPFLVWSAVCAEDGQPGFAPKHRGGWSTFYEHYTRRPEETRFMPHYNASQFKWDGDGDAPVGWAGQVPVSAFVENAELVEAYLERMEELLEKEDIKKLGGEFKTLDAMQLNGRRRIAREKGSDVYVFDVRPAKAFLAGHIDGAMSMPSADCRRTALTRPFDRRLAIFERLTDPERLKVFYGADAGDEDARATVRVARRLAGAHSTKFMILDGGLQAWQMKGLEIATGTDWPESVASQQ